MGVGFGPLLGAGSTGTKIGGLVGPPYWTASKQAMCLRVCHDIRGNHLVEVNHDKLAFLV